MRFSIVPVLFSVAACASQGQPPPMTSEAPPAARVAPPAPPAPSREPIRAPFVLRLEGPTDAAMPGDVVDVAAILTRHGRFPGPILLEARTSEGISLVAGEREEKVEFDDEGEIVRRFRVRVADPRGSLEVSAVLAGDGFGASARKRLTFDGAKVAPREHPMPGGVLQPR